MSNRKIQKHASTAKGATPPQPADIQNRLESALRHHRAGRLQKAKPLYRKVLKQDPGNNDALHMLGLLAHQSGDIGSAIELLGKAAEGNQHSAELFTNFGNALQSAGQLDKAVDTFQTAIRANPEFALAHNNLGNALCALGRHEEAVASFQEAIRLNPGYAAAHYNLGNALHARGEASKAIACFRRALAINPDFSNAASNLASVLVDSGETEEASALFQRALQIDPDNALARHMLAALNGETTASSPPGYVLRLFDGVANVFDQQLVDELGYQAPEFLREAVGRLADDPHKQLDVIDLGCGTGLCGPLFSDLAKSLCGVDLSPNMLAKAEQRGVYDQLLLGDISSELRSTKQAFDLVLAADVFIYVGELRQLFEIVSSTLRAGGLFAFSLEKHEGSGYALRPTGRSAHSLDYIRDLADKFGLREKRGVSRPPSSN
jgi:predicted TPR repeat methyltransferase